MKIPFTIPDAASRDFDLVGLGQNSIDYLVRAPVHPSSDAKLRVDALVQQPGGQVATALAACARLGWRTRYIGAFGDDEAGGAVRDSLVQQGVDVSAAPIVAGARTRAAVILVNASSGERSVLWYRDPNLSLAAVSPSVAASGRLLLVDGEHIDAATAAAAAARQRDVPTLVDVDEVQPGTDALLRHIDIVIAAESFPVALTGRRELGDALETIEREYAPRLVCVTLGDRGSLTRCAGREIFTPATTIECVDSTGAGDVFRGAFAAGCLRWPDGDLERILAYANLAAALSCREMGAGGALPDSTELDNLLASKL